MTNTYTEMKLLNDVWRIIDYMSTVPEEEKAESKAFKKVYHMIQAAYPTRIQRSTSRGVKRMEKGNPEGKLNRHKAMAMGESIKLKKGGKVHKDEAEDKKLIKKMVKKSDLKMAMGGTACKKGGMPKKSK